MEALGTEINHLRKKNAESVTVVGYFNELPDDERFQDELHYALRAYGFADDTVTQVERKEVEKTDWLAEWKKHWKPTDIGGFVIAPPWSDVDERGGIIIRIDPNMAFGTGTHETTQLCLRAIEKYYVPGNTFLDVGTGTGILSIAAAKLNLKSQIADLKLSACDTDVDSVAIAKENAELNGVGELIDFTIGSISDDTPEFDFVCANLTLDVIGPLLLLLLRKARRILVLSGILVEQRAKIVRMLADLEIGDPEVIEAGEWISVTVKVKSKK
jgi:ribosomal protein L11 methyltransferase